jgi:putative peptidoglycan binding protein
MSEVLARIRNDSVLSRPAGASKSGRGLARSLARRLRALPARTYVAAGLLALLIGIAVNALVMQSRRHPAPLFAPSPARISPTPSNANPVPPAPPPDVVRETSPPAPAARATDEIGNWLRGEAPADDSHLVLAAQTALAKLGYAVKADGNEGAATHQALRDFERAHGLPLTTDITPRLVKQLEAVARSQAR